ncbi:prepilin-type N-terminal cleavage/methylation domain-containing protein [Rhodanobacter sp. DHB23]|uniref:prepilin-type N-terminal cleavage/methylation domain-containing protein n=1 Tax=Rhodanobacter sp. DHB23 TaxID=2775923 RepID=UPI00177E7E90|nr:prepilin-type N-terminal cleavage/methylation domain-containing protein [Rhodanobacter sp. DHB23]MBD8871989.1 prepilin-type N-terminal cleavage/methylation domain-containing protein [Rhodanobacter sp. DHB23]
MNRRAPAGFTLIELMVAMLLGLVVIAGVTSVFLANQRAYRTSQALGDVQDNTRMAFEMMARDIRDAGLTGCSNDGRVANVLNNGPAAGGSVWWANWDNALMGYGGSQADPVTSTGTGVGQRVAGTDSLMLLGGEGLGASVQANAEPAATFTFNEASSDFKTGDVLLVCDPDHAALVQATGLAAGAISHAGTGGSPGNCTADLNYPTVCSSSSSYVFATNAQVTRLRAAHWYVGNNPDSSRSLYRVGLVNTGGEPKPTAEEMVRGVTGMSIAYHQSGNAGFVAAGSVGNWALVDAVQVHLWLESADQRAGTDDRALRRDFIATTTVRNRVN